VEVIGGQRKTEGQMGRMEKELLKESATQLSQFSARDTPVSPASKGWLVRCSLSVRLIGGRKANTKI
jgi:hypothetical protein